MVMEEMIEMKDIQKGFQQLKEVKMKSNNSKSLNIFIVIALLCSQVLFVPVSKAEDNEESRQLKLRAVLTPAYAIGPGDQLSITDRTLKELFGQVEKYDIVVSSDGYISIPLPDGKQENILVAGLTLDQVSEEVRKSFGKTLKNPLVFVQISRYRPVNVYIGGEVVKPGVYKIESSSTQEEGGSTSTSSANTFGLSLTQAIQLAGGLKPRANIKNLIVTRGTNNEKRTINLKGLITGESTLDDTNLLPGDAIFVPPAENVEDQAQAHVQLLGKLAYQEVPVNITGEVKSAGSFTLPNDSTLLDAVGKAGGLNTVGTLKLVRLSRYDTDGVYRSRIINIHDLITKGSGFDKIAIRPNDNIELISSKGKEFRHFFRDAGPNILSTSIASFIGVAGNFVVQDNLLNRTARIQNSSLNFGGGSNNPITILGGNRLFNTNSNSK